LGWHGLYRRPDRASVRLSVPARDSQEYEKLPEMWQATVPRWLGIKGVDGHK